MIELAMGAGEFGSGLLQALGLATRDVKEVHIHAIESSFVMVDVIEYLKADDGETVLQHLSLYRLVPRS